MTTLRASPFVTFAEKVRDLRQGMARTAIRVELEPLPITGEDHEVS